MSINSNWGEMLYVIGCNTTLWVSINSIISNKRFQTWRKRGRKIVEQEDPELHLFHRHNEVTPGSAQVTLKPRPTE